jgi:hypothetical protein
MKKSGQFFLLAAVIISAIVISLGVSTNRAVVNEEPDSFYDFSYEVEREIGAVLDYGVYTNFEDEVNLTEFVELLSEEIFEEDPDAEFLLVYGNQSEMKTKNAYAEKEVYVNCKVVEPSPMPQHKQCLKKACKEVNEKSKYYAVAQDKPVQNSCPGKENENEVHIEVDSIGYDFPTTGHNQVIFLMTKDIDGDIYVTAN